MFVLKFVPTIHDEPALQVLTGYQNKSANQIAHSKIIVNTRTNFKTNIGTLQRTFRTYKRTIEVIFQKQIEIESKSFDKRQSF